MSHSDEHTEPFEEILTEMLGADCLGDAQCVRKAMVGLLEELARIARSPDYPLERLASNLRDAAGALSAVLNNLEIRLKLGDYDNEEGEEEEPEEEPVEKSEEEGEEGGEAEEVECRLGGGDMLHLARLAENWMVTVSHPYDPTCWYRIGREDGVYPCPLAFMGCPFAAAGCGEDTAEQCGLARLVKSILEYAGRTGDPERAASRLKRALHKIKGFKEVSA